MSRPLFKAIELTVIEALEGVKITIKDWRELEDDEKMVALLLASNFVGPFVDKLQEYSGYPTELIEKTYKIAQENKIWEGDKVTSYNQEAGSALLVIHSLIMTGIVEQVVENGQDRLLNSLDTKPEIFC